MSPISFVFVELSLWALFSVLWALVGWYSRPSLVVLSLMMVFSWSAFSGFIRWVRQPYGSGRSFALLHFCGLVVSCCGVCTVILYFVWCIDGLARLALLFVSILVWCVHGRGKQNSMDTLLKRPRTARSSQEQPGAARRAARSSQESIVFNVACIRVWLLSLLGCLLAYFILCLVCLFVCLLVCLLALLVCLFAWLLVCLFACLLP